MKVQLPLLGLWSTHVFAQFTAFGSSVAFALLGAAVAAQVVAPVARDTVATMESLSKRVRIDYLCSSFKL